MERHIRWQMQDEGSEADTLDAYPAEPIYDNLEICQLEVGTVQVDLVPFKLLQSFVSILIR